MTTYLDDATTLVPTTTSLTFISPRSLVYFPPRRPRPPHETRAEKKARMRKQKRKYDRWRFTTARERRRERRKAQ